MTDVNLDAYLERIVYTGSAKPTLETLRSLHRLHPEAIPFENLDPFLDRPVGLDPGTLEEKLVRSRRGGYCFEHNLLFMEVLRGLGFSVSGLAARVLWNQPENAITPRSHMLLRVELDGRTWVADVGFGGLTQTAPLLLEPSLEQQTPHEVLQIVEADGYFRLEANVGGTWQKLYRFDLFEQFPVDYAVSNYFTSTNPVSLFRTTLIAARALPGARLALMNNRFTARHLDGRTERRDVADADELSGLLQTEFGIAIPDTVAFAAVAQEKLFEVRS